MLLFILTAGTQKYTLTHSNGYSPAPKTVSISVIFKIQKYPLSFLFINKPYLS